MRVVEIKPPGKITYERREEDFKIFLAGSIEMGKAFDWQTRVRMFFSNWEGEPKKRIVLFNPRRDNWDSSLPQEFSNPQFYQQVSWELNALKQSDLIIMNIDPTTKSPITLLELGLYADSRKMRVVCPKGFWRKGNVDIVCDRYGVPLYEDLEELLIGTRDLIY